MKTNFQYIASILLMVLALFFVAPSYSQSADKSGVKTNTISLPTGPGSIEGLGESYQPSLNTGQGSYGVNVVVPPGTAGFAPSVGLSYNGGGGNSCLGYGWSMTMPFVQRQCDKGIPLYVDENNGMDDDNDGETDEVDELDVFINEMKEELVPTKDGYHFCENEGAFVRYQRVNDYWMATLPDGTKLEFGKTMQARVFDQATGNVHSWLLERMIDTNGNTIEYSYMAFDCPKDLNQKYLEKISYGAGGSPWENFHFVQFNYEDRFDWFEDCRAGFPIRTGMRLKEILTGTQTNVVLKGHAARDFNEDGQRDYLNRKYELNYRTHPHWSLLSLVTWIGSDGVTRYPPISFDYTSVAPADTLSAKNKIMGASNAPFQLLDNPLVDLVDMNGDALPDMLKTETQGNHVVYLNQGENDQQEIVWSSAQQVESEDNLAYNFNLQDGQNAIAHLSDMDGDGLSDFVYKSLAGAVYYFKNKGNASWGSRQRMQIAEDGAAPPSPFGDGTVKTADIDFDKHIDIIQSISTGGGYDYRLWLNKGNNQYAQPKTVTQENGYQLSKKNILIADFNGDRVADIIKIQPTSLSITAGIGHGDFLDPMFVPMPDRILTNEQVEQIKLQDINGDGLVDLILENPVPNELWYWLNLGNYSLDRQRVVKDMPTRFSNNGAVRWADMNGNGTTDYVYAEAGNLQTIDIGKLIGAVPSPNLLKEVDNGIGQKTKLEYTTSTTFLLADRKAGKEWTEPLPFPVNVVAKVTIEDGLGNDYETEFVYHNGYYDGEEKEFRGFAMVESREIGDDSAPDLWMAYEFDTGAKIKALKGKQLSVEARNAKAEVFYQESQLWETKDLFDIVGEDNRKITFPYPTEKTQHILEKGNGEPVQLKWEYEYDDFGNQTRQIEHGRLTGDWDDERVNKATFTAAYPDGQANWIIGGVVEQFITDENDQQVAHSRNYYDKNLELGAISKGNVTQTENWVDSTKYIVASRTDFDEYGNAIAAYDPLYGNKAGHYREIKYDPFFHTFPEEEIIHTGKTNPATLNFFAEYDYGFGTALKSTEFNGHSTTYEYDAFARLLKMTKPLDTIPTMEYDYQLAQPISNNRIINWVETRQLDNSEGDGYLHSRTFSDGLGRAIMTRAEGETTGQVVVTSTVQFNKRKQPRKQYLPYFETGTLDFVDPTFNTGFTEHFYDALSRPIRINQPVGPEGIVFSQTQYEPLVSFVQDEEQTNPASIHFGCGRRTIMDGLQDGKGNPRLRQAFNLVKLSDLGESMDSIKEWKVVYQYDLLDNLTRFTDAQLNQKLFEYDALSRKTFSNDPNRGVMHYTYDDASNLTHTLDAKNQTIRYQYDGLNRLEAEYYGAIKVMPDVRYHYDTPFGEVEKGEFWQAALPTATAQNTLGYLSWITDQSGEEHNSYDARGRVDWTIKRIQDSNPEDLNNYYTGFSYDPMDRVTTLTYPDASKVNYQYNSRGLLESIPNVIHRYDYNSSGQNALLELACGTITNYQYDHRLRLNRIHTVRQTDQLNLQDLNYAFDGVSNITNIDDKRNTTDLDRIGNELKLPTLEARKFNATQSFLYDNLYRLTQAENPSVYGNIQYRYDRTGNMVSKNANLLEANTKMDLGKMISGGEQGSWGRIGRTTNDIAGPNAITSTEKEGMTFSYDANGNMATDKSTEYIWDFKDRLDYIIKNEKQTDYVYDYGDSRKKKISADSSVVFYIDKFSEVRKDSLIRYAYAATNRVIQFTQKDSTFFLYDHLGSTATSLATDGMVKEQSVNHPYGLTRKRKGSIADYIFTGKEQDAESDNFYFEARYYNPSIGSFISVDPLLESGTQISLSSYSYTWNNPVALKDNTGKIPHPAVIGAVAGGLIGAGMAYYTTDGTPEEKLWAAFKGGAAGTVGGAIAGSGVGGLLGGGALAGAASGLLKQGIEMASGERESFDGYEFLTDVVIGAWANKIGGEMGKKVGSMAYGAIGKMASKGGHLGRNAWKSLREGLKKSYGASAGSEATKIIQRRQEIVNAARIGIRVGIKEIIEKSAMLAGEIADNYAGEEESKSKQNRFMEISVCDGKGYCEYFQTDIPKDN